MLIRTCSPLLTLITFVLACTAGPTAAAEEIKIGGSGGAMAMIATLSESFQKANPGSRLTVVSGLGSRGGIKAVASGTLDIGVTSGRPLNDAELKLGLKETEYGRTPFVFAAWRSTKVDGLTLREVVEIYAGKYTKWPDALPVRLILRPAGDSDTAIVRDISPELQKANVAAHERPGMVMAVTDGDSADLLEKTPGAFGTTTLGQIASEKRNVKVLKYEGVEPTVKNAMEGRYPLYKRLCLVVGPGSGVAAHKFIDFVRSPAGQDLLKRNGHWVQVAN